MNICSIDAGEAGTQRASAERRPTAGDVRTRRSFVISGSVGISRYVCNIAMEMHRMAGITPQIVAPFHFNEYLDQLPRSLVRGRRVHWLEGLTALAYGLSVLPGKVAARNFKPDVLHNTYYFPIKPPQAPAAILTVYDMNPREVSQVFAAAPSSPRIKLRACGRGSRDLHFREYPA